MPTRAPRAVSDKLLWFGKGKCWRFAYRDPATGKGEFILCTPGKFTQGGVPLPDPSVVRRKTQVAEKLCRELQRQFLASLASVRPETVMAEAPKISKAAAEYLAIYTNQDPGYRKTLTAIFAEFQKTVGDKPVDRVTDADLKAYELRLAKRCKRATVRSYLRQFSMLLTFCQRKGWLRADPRATFRMPREELRAPNPFTTAELKAFFTVCRNAPPPHDWSSWEWAGVGMLTLGLRPVELIHARWENVNWDERLLWIDRSHGAKEREARAHQPVPLAVWPLFCERRRASGPIWTDGEGEPLTEGMLARGRKSISGHVPGFTWKRFRKTYATIIAENDGDSMTVSRLLRHSAGGTDSSTAGKHYVGRSMRFLRAIVDEAFATLPIETGMVLKVTIESAAQVVDARAVGMVPTAAAVLKPTSPPSQPDTGAA